MVSPSPVASTAVAPALHVQVSVSRCGEGWSGGAAGHLVFTVDNTDSRAGEAYLADAGTGAVYAELESLGPGSSAKLAVDLGSGRYRFRCSMDDAPVVDGPTVTVSGAAHSTSPDVRPVTQLDLIRPTLAYQAYVTGRLPDLLADTTALHAALARGDIPAARQAWLTAHLDYERLGAAYGAFGDADAQINGLPDGLRGGVHDPEFTGFHRIELGLWGGESAAALVRPASVLVRSEKQLINAFGSAQIDPLEVSIRAHEISENALQFELTGHTDFGSHSNLATVSANLDGTAVVLRMIRPLLVGRYPDLPRLDRSLVEAKAAVARERTPAGGWTPLLSLPIRSREQLNADVAELTELLAPVASICQPRRTS